MLTKERLTVAYEFLREFSPFKGWKLPPSTAIDFQVAKDPTLSGYYTRINGTQHHYIGVSQASAGHPTTLLRIMAHEMIHLKQALRKTETPNTKHNAEFRRIAGRVCKKFGWDAKDFFF